MKISASTVSADEHWLTLMTCIICENTPDHSPVYKCNLGHTICYPCFQNLIENDIPVCNKCGSEEFTRQDVSSDFLRKLKTKPGIGRPCRYTLDDRNDLLENQIDNNEPDVTVEQLFQLPKQKLNHLFGACTKEKLRFLNSLQASECVNTKFAAVANQQIEKTARTPVDMPPSRKPLQCPHDLCNKMIAISSFKSHYQYEHSDFKRFSVLRSEELSLTFDPSVIEHGRSVCVGIISLLANHRSDHNSKGVTHMEGDQTETDTFWIMVTGSAEDNDINAYILFWLFTNKDENEYNCTMELSSQNDMMTMTAFCRVNDVYESQNVKAIEKNLNCLFVTYRTMKSMLGYGPKMKFRLTIH